MKRANTNVDIFFYIKNSPFKNKLIFKNQKLKITR